MGRIWMPGGGGGADLDAVTAGAGNVLEGKVIVDKDGNPLTGTMPDKNVVGKNGVIGVSNNYPTTGMTPVSSSPQYNTATDGLQYLDILVPEGYYNGYTYIGTAPSKVAPVIGVTASKVAQGQTIAGITGTYKGLGNAAAADVRKGKTFSTAALSNATGTMAEKGAQTYTPKSTAQSIAANQYLTGAQTIAGDGNLVAANIKKNVTIFGVKGTWSGYVADATDLYLRGNNIVGWSGEASFDSGQITIDSSPIDISATINFTGYTKLNFEIYEGYTGGSYNSIVMRSGPTASYPVLARVDFADSIGAKTLSIDISALQKNGKWYFSIIGVGSSGKTGAIYRIWLS